MRAFTLPRGFLSVSRLAGSLLTVVLAAVSVQPASGQAPADVSVVVHADVPIENLSRAELRRIVLGDREFWTSGVRVAILIRAPVARERDAIVRDVCQMTEAQFRRHWIAKVFRADTPSSPKLVYSREMALDQVSRVPGAITFVEGPVSGTGVKVLKIDGRSPGQAGYSLK
jgi:hypothetical protein